MSCLFTYGELRGRDASGFWVWRKDHYVFEKRPIPAQDLIYRSMGWKSLRFNPGSLYLAHTRSTTDGDPNINANNHPHVGKHTVMVHNGMVFAFENIAKGYNFDMQTDCDSEVLVHLAEYDEDMKKGLQRMMHVTTHHTGMASVATAFVDRRNPTEILLSRNSGNPLHIFECERLKCSFFCSTPEIFKKALKMLYGEDTLHNLGFKETVVEVNKLYRLKADGSFTKEDLVNFTHQSQSVWTGSSPSGGDTVTTLDMSKQSKHPLAYASIFGEDFELGIDGTLKPFGTEEENEEEAEVETFDVMPPDIKKELIQFLELNKT